MPQLDTHSLESFGRQAPYAWVKPGDPPVASGQIRSVPEDFVVVEELGFEPDGDGSHLLVCVTKRERNTVEAAHWLSSVSGAAVRDIGYCGLKDRHAVTSQWFSVPGSDAVAQKLRDREATGFKIDEVATHGRKLRRGSHLKNSFQLCIRELEDTHSTNLTQSLERIRDRGVPNYFGPQRFGPDGDNVRAALDMLLSGRRPKRKGTRGILMSSLRSALFNLVLSRRVKDDNWDSFLEGDLAVKTGSRTHFSTDFGDPILGDRLASGEVHPTGPMWGEGDLLVSGECQRVEEEVLSDAELIRRALESAGLKHERRALRLIPSDFTWAWEPDGNLSISFGLSPGSYATAVLRELIAVKGDVRPWGSASIS